MIKVRLLELLDILHRMTDEEHILNSHSLVEELSDEVPSASLPLCVFLSSSILPKRSVMPALI